MAPSKEKSEEGSMSANFSMNSGVMQMLNGFTVLRLTSLVGMVGLKFTKEDLLKMNKQLNRIRKPKNLKK